MQNQDHMPMFLQGHATHVAPEAQVAPEQQPNLLQQAPVDPAVKKLKTAKANVEQYKKRVKITSNALIFVGLLGMATSFYKMMTAGKRSDEMIHGRHHGHHPHHPHHNATDEEGPRGPKYVTQDQFELYDILKTLTTVSFFIFAKVLAIGKCGKMMVWRNKSTATHWLGKKSCFGFLFIVLMSIYAAQQKHHVKMIMKRVHDRPHHHLAELEPETMNYTYADRLDKEPGEKPLDIPADYEGRHLSEDQEFPKVETVWDRYVQSLITGKDHKDGRPQHFGHHQRGADTSSPREEHSQGGKHFGRHGRKHHHKKGCCKIVKLLAAVLFSAHFFFIRRLKQEQEKLEKITGNDKKDACGDWKKKRVAVQEPTVVYMPVVQTTVSESSIEEISEDKVEGAPPTGHEANRNFMN